MNPFGIIGFGVLAFAVTFIANWLALVPWRRAKGAHWTERARLLYPARVAVIQSSWQIPVILTIVFVLVEQDHSVTFLTWPWVALLSAVGVVVGSLPMTLEIDSGFERGDLIYQTFIGFLMRASLWSVFVAAAVIMPYEFNGRVLNIFGTVLLLHLLYSSYGWLHIMRKLKFVEPAPERVRSIAREVATKMNCEVNEILVFRSRQAQAYALLNAKSLMFSRRFIEITPDDELAAVCAHEIGHLTESKEQAVTRNLLSLVNLPWLLFKPLIGCFGIGGFFMLVVHTYVTPLIIETSALSWNAEPIGMGRRSSLKTALMPVRCCVSTRTIWLPP